MQIYCECVANMLQIHWKPNTNVLQMCKGIDNMLQICGKRPASSLDSDALTKQKEEQVEDQG